VNVVADQADRAGGEDADRSRVEERDRLVDGRHQLLLAAEDDLVFLEVGGHRVVHEVGRVGRSRAGLVPAGEPAVEPASDRAVRDLEDVAGGPEHHAFASGVSAAAHGDDAGGGSGVGQNLRHDLTFFHLVDDDLLFALFRQFRRIGFKELVPEFLAGNFHFIFFAHDGLSLLSTVESVHAAGAVSNPDGIGNRHDEDFPVTAFAGAVLREDGLDRLLDQVVRDDHGDHPLGDQPSGDGEFIHLLFPVLLGAVESQNIHEPLPASEDVLCMEPGETRGQQSLLGPVDFANPDDGDHFFHRLLLRGFFHTRAHRVNLIDRADEDLAVAESAFAGGPGGVDDLADHEILVFGRNHHHEHFLGDLIVGDVADLDAALFASAGHAHSGDGGEALFHQDSHDGIDFLRTDDRSDHNHNWNSLSWGFCFRVSRRCRTASAVFRVRRFRAGSG